VTGKVKTIRSERGFGFILAEDGVERFFHSTNVAGTFEDLREGDRVEFDDVASAKGPRATNVRTADALVGKENA
jgi:CspA family cold shock protein